jgi:hypothetical protein
MWERLGIIKLKTEWREWPLVLSQVAPVFDIYVYHTTLFNIWLWLHSVKIVLIIWFESAINWLYIMGISWETVFVSFYCPKVEMNELVSLPYGYDGRAKFVFSFSINDEPVYKGMQNIRWRYIINTPWNLICRDLKTHQWCKNLLPCLQILISMLSGSLVTTAWRVLRLRLEEKASRYWV